MPSKLSKMFGAAACCALLVSCGGGGNNDPAPTPTPTGSGTPTPTPSATPIVFDFSEDFAATSLRQFIYAYFTPDSGGAEVWSDGRILNDLSGVAFVLDPEEVFFRFIGAEDPVQFAGSDRTGASATLRTYENSSGTLFLEVPFEHVLRTVLERTDPYIRNTVPGTLRSQRVALFINPVTTDDPIASTFAYAGSPEVAGGLSGTTPSGAISAADTTFTVTPAASGDSGPALSGTIVISQTIGGTTTQVASLALNATVATETEAFGGTITDTGSGFTGQFAGTLAGPNREELFFIFRITHSDGRKFLGSFIGKR